MDEVKALVVKHEGLKENGEKENLTVELSGRFMVHNEEDYEEFIAELEALKEKYGA